MASDHGQYRSRASKWLILSTDLMPMVMVGMRAMPWPRAETNP